MADFSESIHKYTVSQVNSYIKNIISEDMNLSGLFITGEISNFKNHYSGHLYFTLKDSNSVIKCIMFKSYASALTFRPEEGMKVILYGSVNVFERDGTYQVYCESMQPDGIGSLAIAFEQLKDKLQKEGLFDRSHKKSLPSLPKSIAVVSSSTGAVIRDIINVSTNRFPGVHIRLFPVAVQGTQAATQIAYAIRRINELNTDDVIIIARGGGSLEDLWPFNEELVARAVYASDIPIISAVGHETDFTICDFTADVRASTPSHAAEIAVPIYRDEIIRTGELRDSLVKSFHSLLQYEKLYIRKLQDTKALRNPAAYLSDKRIELDGLIYKCQTLMNQSIEYKKTSLANLCSKLKALDPYAVLLRGYTAVTADGENIPIISIDKLCINDKICVRFKDGKAICKVESTERGSK